MKKAMAPQFLSIFIILSLSVSAADVIVKDGKIGIGGDPSQEIQITGAIHASGDICALGGSKCLSSAGGGGGGPQVFFETFTNFNAWNEGSDWDISNSESTDGSSSAHVDNANLPDSLLTLSGSVDLSSFASATLSADLFFDGGWDNNEYLCMQYSCNGGSSWLPSSIPDGGVGGICQDGGSPDIDVEGSFRTVSVDVGAACGSMPSNFKIRFSSISSSGIEDGYVDAVTITASASGGGGGTTPWQTTGSDIFYDAGKVGIGITNPSQPLEIQGNADQIKLISNPGIGSASIMFNKIETGNLWRIGYGIDISGDHFEFYDQKNSLLRMVIQDTGNVGIGTSIPNSPLQVMQASSGIKIITDFSASNNIAADNWNQARIIRIGKQSGDPAKPNMYKSRIISYYNPFQTWASRLQLQTHTGAGTDDSFHAGIMLNEFGNVGIGTSTPKGKLDVNGVSVKDSKSFTANSAWGNALAVDLGATHRSARLKVWFGGNDWSCHSAPSYIGEFILKTGSGFGQPGTLISQVVWGPGTDDTIEAQLTFSSPTTINLQLRTKDVDGDGFDCSLDSTNQILVYEVDGNFVSIS